MNTADIVYADRQKQMKLSDEVTRHGYKPLPEKRPTRFRPAKTYKRRARASR